MQCKRTTENSFLIIHCSFILSSTWSNDPTLYCCKASSLTQAVNQAFHPYSYYHNLVNIEIKGKFNNLISNSVVDNTIKASIFEGFVSRRSRRSVIIFSLAEISSQLHRNWKISTKLCGTAKWDPGDLFLCPSDWFCFCNTYKAMKCLKQSWNAINNLIQINMFHGHLFGTCTPKKNIKQCST